MKSSLTVLLVHDPIRTDSRYVGEVREILTNAGLNILLDVQDIPRTKHFDPFQWYNDAFERADLVAIFAHSPHPLKAIDEPTKQSIYKRNYDLALQLLVSHTSRQSNLPSDRNPSGSFLLSPLDCCVVFQPHAAGQDDIPQCCSGFRRFAVPREVSLFVEYARKWQKQPKLTREIHFSEGEMHATDTICQSKDRENETNYGVQGTTAERRSLIEHSGPELIDDQSSDKLDQHFGNILPGVAELTNLLDAQKLETKEDIVLEDVQSDGLKIDLRYVNLC